MEFLQESYEVPARDRFSVTHAMRKRRLSPRVELGTVRTDGHRRVVRGWVEEGGEGT